MTGHHLVRVGAMGHVGRFSASDATCYPRGLRIIVRTARGLEIGQVLSPPQSAVDRPSDGVILRRMTIEDQLLEQRLEQNKHAAYEACRQRLTERGHDAVLMDVEHLFDGRSLYFYFLGDVPVEVAAITDELADAYETKVQFKKFTETVLEGCGPDCGTENAQGCGSCATGCAVSAACASRPAP